MKKLILFISLVTLMYSANAQNTCPNAIDLGGNDTCLNNTNMTDSVIWFKFIANSEKISIAFPGDSINIVNIYTGSCDSLVLFDSYTYTSTDSSSGISNTNFIIGNLYYVEVIQTKTSSINICISSFSFPLCAAGPCSQQITNGDFTSVNMSAGYDASAPFGYVSGTWVTPARVSCWVAGLATPQIGTSAPHSPPNYAFMRCNYYPGYVIPVSEAILATVNVVNGQTYTLTYWEARYTALSPFTVSEVNVYLAKLGVSNLPSTSNSVLTFSTAQRQMIDGPPFGNSNITSGTWVKRQQTFVANDNYDQLIIYPQQSFSSTANEAWIKIDDVTLEEGNYFPSPSSLTICSGNLATIALNSAVPGATFSWTVAQTGVSGASAGTGSAISQTLSTTSASIGTAIYTITPTSSTGCVGIPFTVTITVNPSPPPFIISGSTTSCPGPSPNYTISPVQSGVTYTWTTSTGASGSGTTALYSFPTSGGTITFTGIYLATGGCSYTTSLYVGSCCAPPATPVFTNKNTSAVAFLGTTAFGITTLTNQIIAINGTFNVNQSLSLVGCDLRMGYLAKIIVDPGMTLTITNNGNDKTHIYACNEMWDGIDVSNPTSLVIINNGSTVEDALSAIVSDNKGNFQVDGNLSQGNVIFNKNYKSIVVKNALTGSHPGYVRATTIQCYDGVVGGNPVNTLNKLHFPHATERSNMGVELTDVNNIIIGTFVSIKLNTFDNLDFGINSSNSSLSVYNNNFKNITLSGTVAKGIECLTGTAICAKGGKAVLRTINVGSASAIPFYKNTFSNDFRGVVVTEFMNANIWKNNFANVTTGIRVSKNYTRNLIINENVINNSRVGIDCFDNLSANVTVDNNDIDAGTLLQASGVLAQEILAGTTVYKISRNTIKNVRYGIFGIGLKNSNVDRNNIYLKHTTVPTQECYGVRLANSSFCNVVANWVLGTNSADYWIHGISLDLCTSDYVVCNESHNLGTGMFFGGDQTPNTFIAKNLMKNNYRGLVINFGIVGEQGVVGTPNDNRWAGSFTYHTFSYNSFCAPFPWYVRAVGAQFNPSPYLFFTTIPTQEVPLNPTSGTLPLACPLIILGGGSPRTPIMLQIAGDSIAHPAYDVSARWMLKQSLYQYLKTDPSLITTEPLIAQFKNDYTINNMGKLDDVETSLSNPATITPGILTTIQALNNTVTPASDVEINSKWMNGLLIENALSGSDYSVSQLNDLRILAAKCPYNDGPAVYQSRVILSQVENVEYINECEMVPDIGTRNMSTFTQPDESENNEFKLFPNPNDGTMNFIYSLNETSKGDMKIFDLTGKIIASYSLKIGINNQILINETQLSNGVYFYKVVIDNELKSSDKIVIIK